MTTETNVKIKSLTKCQLAGLYNVNPRTFSRWLIPFLNRVGDPPGESRIYTPQQVKVIFECLGEP